MKQLRVAVLRGGPSGEHEVSLATGKTLLDALSHHHTHDVYIDKEGKWHKEGIHRKPLHHVRHVDVVVIGLHGTYGEDGEVQRMLERFGVPYTGTQSIQAAIAINKKLTKSVLAQHGIAIPRDVTIPSEMSAQEAADHIFRTIGVPVVVKPVAEGSSLGVVIAKTYLDLAHAIEKAREVSQYLMAEEFIQGREATCGVIDDFRHHAHYALPPVEIQSAGEFFDYHAKYHDERTKEICPATFGHDMNKQIEQLAVAAHKALGLRHYSRSDFIIHPRRGPIFLEVNTHPGLTPTSLLPKSLKAVGSSLDEFANHIVALALRRR